MPCLLGWPSCWCVSTVFYVVTEHVCNLSGWQPVRPWAAASWWTPIAPTERGKPAVWPAALDISLARMQPKTRHICLQHHAERGTSAQQSMAIEKDAGDSVFKYDPDPYTFHGSAPGWLVHLLACFPLPRHAWQPEYVPSSQAMAAPQHAAWALFHRQEERVKATSFQSPLWPLPRASGITNLKGRLPGTLRMLNKRLILDNSMPFNPVYLRRSAIALQSEPLKIVCVLKSSQCRSSFSGELIARCEKKEQTRIWIQRQGSTLRRVDKKCYIVATLKGLTDFYLSCSSSWMHSSLRAALLYPYHPYDCNGVFPEDHILTIGMQIWPPSLFLRSHLKPARSGLWSLTCAVWWWCRRYVECP